MIPRAYEPLEERLAVNKALVIFGPRRVGKTTLLKKMLDETKLNYKLDSGDNIRSQQVLGSQDFKQILAYAEGYSLIAIDEAQNIANVGMGIKILLDQIPGLRVIVTGSSSFGLAGQFGGAINRPKNDSDSLSHCSIRIIDAAEPI
jgi:predicted AAA+ superfamily ATPase